MTQSPSVSVKKLSHTVRRPAKGHTVGQEGQFLENLLRLSVDNLKTRKLFGSQIMFLWETHVRIKT